MNRRGFLRNALLGAVAMALPKGKDEKRDLGTDSCFELHHWPPMEHPNCRCVYAPIDIGDGHHHYLRLDAEDEGPDLLSQIQLPDEDFEARVREYLEQLRRVADEYVRFLGDFVKE